MPTSGGHAEMPPYNYPAFLSYTAARPCQVFAKDGYDHQLWVAPKRHSESAEEGRRATRRISPCPPEPAGMVVGEIH